MTIYKPSDIQSDVQESFRKRNRNIRARETDERCQYGSNCSSHCHNESNNLQQRPFNFSNNNDAFVQQEAGEFDFMDQESAELIWVKESCNIRVSSTDTQAGVSLQAGLQLAIALVLNISIADSSQRESVSQELMQQFHLTQKNKQKIFIYNTRDAVVTTQDTDLALNIQALFQVLLTLVILIDIL